MVADEYREINAERVHSRSGSAPLGNAAEAGQARSKAAGVFRLRDGRVVLTRARLYQEREDALKPRAGVVGDVAERGDRVRAHGGEAPTAGTVEAVLNHKAWAATLERNYRSGPLPSVRSRPLR